MSMPAGMFCTLTDTISIPIGVIAQYKFILQFNSICPIQI